jgi:transcriptional regulator PpsR
MNLSMPQAATIPFRRAGGALGDMSSDVATMVIAAAGDIALVIDRDGIVRDLSITSHELAGNGWADWIDRPWIETVTSESRHKVAEMLGDAGERTSPRWRELNHPGTAGASHPVRYMAVRPDDDGRVIVIGRDLQSSAALQQRLLLVQQSVERDYLKLRQAESRYRLLFQSTSEPVLILDASTRKIREANPAAVRLTTQGKEGIDGHSFSQLLEPGSVEAANTFLGAATTTTQTAPVPVTLLNGATCLLSAALFRQDRTSALLVRLLSPDHNEPPNPQSVFQDVLARIPDAFVVTDADMRILAVNPAFVECTQLSSTEEAVNLPLDGFLGRPQVDLKILLSQLKEHGSVRNFATILRGRYGDPEEVEVSAVIVPDETRPTFGFSIRIVSRRLQATMSASPAGVPQSIEQLTQLIGRVPMKEIVRESTDLIERLCIEAALALTSDNRASAADVLGLSRQSLYSKLRRYGLGNLDDTDD